AAAEREVLHPHRQGRPERRGERRHSHGVSPLSPKRCTRPRLPPSLVEPGVL
ncbi:MAG: hypothetical protein AVDCRST_MAG55-1477, partial [uncultured Rubrobacteraceae bacterium]